MLTVNGTRRVAVARSIDEVRAALRGGDTPGFLQQLGDMVRDVGSSVASSVQKVQNIVVRADVEFLEGPCAPVIEAFCASFPMASASDSPRAVGPGDLLVSMHQEFSFERLTSLEDEVSSNGARWGPFWRDAAGARFGPFRDDDTSPTIRDLAARWVSAAYKDAHGRALLKPPAEIVHSTPVTPVEFAYEVGVFLHDVALWISGGRPRAWWHTIHLGRAGSVVADPVLPMPNRILPMPARNAWTTPDDTGLSPMDVVNSSAGIVRRLRTVKLRTPMPPEARFVESQTADMARLGPWAANIYNAGSSWGDVNRARAGAVGEAVERYCGNFVDFSAVEFGSFDEIARRGIRVLDPRELVLFSSAQYADPRFPFVPFERSTRTHWVTAVSLVDGEEVLVPASVTFVNWNTGRALFSPRTNPAYYPGIAAAPTRESALANALEEVVERDAAMVWWWSGHRLPTSEKALVTVERLVPTSWQEANGMRVHVTPLTNAVGLTAMAVAVEARQVGLLTVGLAVRQSPEAAIEKALLEALGLVETAVDMHDPQGGFWKTYQPGERSGAVRPMRADRRYLDSYRSDFRDVSDLFCQLQVQLDPRSYDIVRGRIGAPAAGDMKLPHFAERDFRAYVRALADEGFEPLAVDLTTPDVAAAGWHAVRVIVPGLVPNFPTAFPPLGRGRLMEQPVSLGWRDERASADDLWSFPMPYA